MVGIVDEIIKHDIRCQKITIVRPVANVTSYGIVEITGIDTGRRRLDPYYDFENIIRMPSNCSVINGDMLLINGEYYLVMAVEQKRFLYNLAMYKLLTYKCNSTVNIYSYDVTTKGYNTLSKIGVRCLITQVRTMEWPEDKAVMIPKYRGKQQPFQLFIQESSGIVSGSDCVLIDQANRRFRINKSVDVFITDGISQTQIMWER